MVVFSLFVLGFSGGRGHAYSLHDDQETICFIRTYVHMYLWTMGTDTSKVLNHI